MSFQAQWVAWQGVHCKGQSAGMLIETGRLPAEGLADLGHHSAANRDNHAHFSENKGRLKSREVREGRGAQATQLLREGGKGKGSHGDLVWAQARV